MNTRTTFLPKTLLAIVFSLSISTIFSVPLLAATVEPSSSFEVTIEAERVVLCWNLEKNTADRVFVQRAGTDMQFVTISEQQETVSDEFVDQPLRSGLSFYRLALYQADGTITYHKTIIVSP